MKFGKLKKFIASIILSTKFVNAINTPKEILSVYKSIKKHTVPDEEYPWVVPATNIINFLNTVENNSAVENNSMDNFKKTLTENCLEYEKSTYLIRKDKNFTLELDKHVTICALLGYLYIVLKEFSYNNLLADLNNENIIGKNKQVNTYLKNILDKNLNKSLEYIPQMNVNIIRKSYAWLSHNGYLQAYATVKNLSV